ncbi:amino acid adenylation domain-containing protein [Gordonia sputi]|uniref:amino acid adenylation domain-containing protein n=1 Tax=Gordonia sputi TaxID=36823 RepID=UPI0036B0AA70
MPSAFTDTQVDALATSVLQVLRQIAEAPTTPVRDVTLLDRADTDRMARAWGDQGLTPQTLPEMFTATAARTPGSDALTFRGAAMSYAELDSASSALARQLIATGVGPETVVLCAFDRSAVLQVVLWAVAKAGAVFCPIDPRYPSDRVRMVVEDSGATIGLAQPDVVDGLPDGENWIVPEWIGIDDESLAATLRDHSSAPVTDADRRARLDVDNGAYMIFTSGSTGRPKGVLVTHRGVGNVATALREKFGADNATRWLGVSSPAFDAAFMEVLATYPHGGTLVIAPSDVYGGPALGDLMRGEQVTGAFMVNSVAASVPVTEGLALRDILVGGEALAPGEVGRWTAADSAPRFHNVYGPTETTIICTGTGPLTAGEPITIGGPLDGVHALVLDDHLRPVPIGVAGELYIAGNGLARGYVERAAQTSERFVPNPYDAPGARMYRTGDRVRWASSTALEYLGRTDFQVKIRGLRIELGEIEAAFSRIDGVTGACVIDVARPDGPQLAGYVTVDPDVFQRSTADGSDDRAIATRIRTALSALLPAYMVPASVTVLDSLPRTPIGKVDRRALPEPDFGPDRDVVAPRDEKEEAIAAVFADVLGADEVSVTESFFDMGGNSLSATRVAGRLSALMGEHVGVRVLFENPTVAGLGAVVPTSWSGSTPGSAEASSLVPQARGETIPLSFAQQRMWLVNQIDPTSAGYNIPFVLEMKGHLDVDALRAAFVDVLARHTTLRTVYPQVDEVVRQQVIDQEAAAQRLEFDVVAASPDELSRRSAEIISGGFDVTTDLPIRVTVLQAAPGECTLVVVLHHIAADGFSLGPLQRDLVTAYAARRSGQAESILEALPVDYADFAIWQRNVLGNRDDQDSLLTRQLDYWTRVLASAPEVTPLATDRPRPPIASKRGDAVAVEVDEATRAAVTRFARRHRMTPFMVWHLSLAILVAQSSPRDDDGVDVVIGSPVAGRGDRALDDMVGMFVNNVVLRTPIRSSDDVAHLVEQVRSVDVEAFAHSDVPFEVLVDELVATRTQAFESLFQVGFTYQNFDPVGGARVHGGPTRGAATQAAAGADADLQIEAVAPETEYTRHDLGLTLADVVDADGRTDGAAAVFHYATDLFDRPTVESMGRRWMRIVRAILSADNADALSTTSVGAVAALSGADLSAVTAAESGEVVDTGVSTWAELIDRRCVASADEPAIITPERTWTFADLAVDARRLARRLIGLGVGPDEVVSLGIRHSVHQMIAVYAIGLSGGAYSPADPHLPVERLTTMRTVTGASALVTLAEDRDVFAAAGFDNIIVLDEPSPDATATDLGPIIDADRASTLRPDNAAYVMFTSGSTGTPKGVVVTQRNLVNFAQWWQSRVGHDATHRRLRLLDFVFDGSLDDIVAPMAGGCALVVADEALRDVGALAEQIERYRITSVSAVPALLSTLFEIAAPSQLSSLRLVDTGGEAISPDLARRIIGGGAKLVNGYGPAETTVNATDAIVTADRLEGMSVPIGEPVWNSRLLVLGERMQRCPVGVPGELYVAGRPVTRGYASQPALTSSRYVASPFGGGERMYRTGDIVRWRRDGSLEYLGRNDHQMKLRGQRLEPGEIEARIAAVDGITQVMVTVVDDERGNAHLVAYLAGNGDAQPETASIRSEVERELPNYMVPTTWVVLDEWPTNNSGKLDRSRLPVPDFGSSAQEFVSPVGIGEVNVAEVFARILGVDRVGADQNFFDLGGNSLSAARLVAALRERTAQRVELSWVFADPTVRGIAARLDAEPGDVGMLSDVVIALRSQGARAPLFCIHPAGGLAWFYGGLAPYLTDRPIYGVQDPHVVADEPLADSVTSMARRYVAEIRRIQPSGPYHLLGWSLGGVVAHEMAVQLDAAGEHVGVLAVMDAAVGLARPEASVDDESSAGGSGSAGEGSTATPDVAELLGAWRELFDLEPAQGAAAPEDVIALIRSQLSATGLFDDAQIDRVMESFASAEEVSPQHDAGIFDGPMTVFTALQGKSDPASISRAWRPFATGGIDNHDVDVPHLGMTDRHALSLIGPVLEARLRDEDERSALGPRPDSALGTHVPDDTTRENGEYP